MEPRQGAQTEPGNRKLWEGPGLSGKDCLFQHWKPSINFICAFFLGGNP